MSADDILGDMIASIRRCADLPTEAAKIGAPLVESVAKTLASSGVTPQGEPWAAKKDGARALVHAADALSATSAGPTITLRLKGPEVIHNFGTHRVPKRQILPDAGAGVPKLFGDAIVKAATKAFEKAVA